MLVIPILDKTLRNGFGVQSEIKNIGHKKLSKLRDLVTACTEIENDLGGGNFIPPKVYKE